MARVTLAGVTRRYGERAAVDGIDLRIADGEVVALLGPSGCGKTTLLRLIAGFERLDAGSIRIGGALVSAPDAHVDPEDRRVGVVFQSYALWPHLDVAGNVGYALRVRGLRRAEREDRTTEALVAVGLGDLGRRRIQELSGGQRQRVALARCLAMHPSVVLLDEPLSNLDAQLRETMLDEFRRFHALTRATMVYVTHDQSEAMALADRIAVMHEGSIRQVAAPGTLYAEPASALVAGFIGRGARVPVEVLSAEGATARVRLWGSKAVLRCRPGTRPGPAAACLRPEDLTLGASGIPADVVAARFEGDRTRLTLAPHPAPDCHLTIHADGGASPPVGAVVHAAVRDGWVLPDAGGS